MRHANPKMTFSPRERTDLLKAWLLTSLAFSIFFIRGGMIAVENIVSTAFLLIFAIAAVTAGLGFIVHELCHKLAAYHFGVHGEFRANTGMLFMSILLAFMGFLFAAPGAVHILGQITKRENGIISAAGPLSNMVLALLFMPLAFLSGEGSLLGLVGVFGLLINAILGAFNLIPFLGLDGSKILAWNKWVYALLVVIAVVLVMVGYSVF